MSLSSLIVRREIATIREVEEALARQVLYGGDLVTNLLEVSPVTETALVSLVAESVSLPAAPLGELPTPSDAARKLVAAEVAFAHNFAPLEIDGGGLVVAVAEPLSAQVEQDLVFALGQPLLQRVAPLVRVRQALARDYGVPLERRHQRLLTRLADGAGRRPESSLAPRPTPEANLPPRPPSAGPVAPLPPTPPPPPGELRTLVRDVGKPPPTSRRRRRGPLTPEVARAELEDAVERDTIFDLLFEFARQYFDYTALFVVHGDHAEGRDAFGQGSSRERVARIAVPLETAGMLASAREAAAPMKIVPSSSGMDAILMADLGRGGQTECVVVPVVVRKRVVALLLGDGGDAGVDPVALAEVQGLATQCVASFERLIVRRKLKGGLPAPGGLAFSRVPVPESTPRTLPDVPDSAPSLGGLGGFGGGVATGLAGAGGSGGIVRRELPKPSSPPPANLLSVRRASGPPIPREEPSVLANTRIESRPRSEFLPPAREIPSVAPDPRRDPSTPAPPPLEATTPDLVDERGIASTERQPLVAMPLPSATPSAPPGPNGFGVDDVERRLIAEIEGRAAPEEVAPVTSPSRVSSPPRRSGRPSAPDFGPPASPKAESPPSFRAVAPVAEPEVSAPSIARSGTTEVSATALPMFEGPITSPSPNTERAVPAARASGPRVTMPPSEQQISVPAHRPPVSRRDSSGALPSVIIDMGDDYTPLLDRVVRGDEEAEAALVRVGGPSMPTIMTRFPGPLTLEGGRLGDGAWPRASECGPVLRLVASQRRTALPYVLALGDEVDVERRLWATYLLTELVYVEALDTVCARVLDTDARVRRAARLAARALAEVAGAALVERLAIIAADPSSRGRRVFAIEALGQSREPLAVPALLHLLEDSDADVVPAVRAALVALTRQDFGTDRTRWQSWWSENEARERLEWLIDALMHEHAAIRATSSEELKAITKEYFGYYEDLPKRERERAQARYREWWNSVGRQRFGRATSSRKP